MSQKLFFAQKGVILNEDKSKILLIYYADSKFLPEQLKNKYGLPGGRLNFGEDLDKGFIREIKEETGIDILPGQPISLYTWQYKKAEDDIQIIACGRIGYFVSGSITKSEKESEVELGQSIWKSIDELKDEDLVEDELPTIEKLKELKISNTL